MPRAVDIIQTFVEGSTTTEYVYSGHDPICDKSGSTYTDYVYLNGRLKLKMIGADSYWYIDDALGSTRLVYKGTVKVYSVKTYKPFGIAYGASGTEKFTYAGEMMDSPTGLIYLFARCYDPEAGRFISLDPRLGSLSMPQTLNRYVYCANNPMRFTDPTGEWFWDDVGKWASENWQTIVQVAIVVVAVVATVATAGIASPLAAMAVGAAIGGVSNFASTMVETGGDLGASLVSAAFGAVLGAVTVGGTMAAMKMVSKAAATKLSAQVGGKVISTESRSFFSRAFDSAVGNELGSVKNGYGYFGKDGSMFKIWDSKALYKMVGPLGQKTPPNTAGLFGGVRSFYLVEKTSPHAIGTEYLIPMSTGKTYLRWIFGIPFEL